MTRWHVVAGIAVCETCGARDHKEAPDAGELVCPGCGGESLYQTAAGTQGQAIESDAWFACRVCSWHGPLAKVSSSQLTRADVERMLDEDKRKGVKGGGGRSGGRKKPPKFHQDVPLGDRIGVDDDILSSRVEQLARRTEVVRVRNLDADEAEIRAALAADFAAMMEEGTTL